MSSTVKNVVLVHGAFADGSSWSKVIPLSQEMDYHVLWLAREATSERFPFPIGVRAELELAAAAIDRRRLFRRVNKVGRTWGDGMTVKAVWHIVKESARRVGVAKLVPHDLQRTCARLCHASGGELEQIQFLLGHVSVQTTERYLGC